MTQIIVTRGLPASGKSTWTEEFIKQEQLSFGNVVIRIERDMLRDQLYGHLGRVYTNFSDSGMTDEQFKQFMSDRENTVSAVQKSMADAATKAGKSVVISDTNLRATYVREWAKFASERGLAFNVFDFDHLDLDTLISRDKNRANSVGEKVIRDMWNKFTKNGKLRPVDVSREMAGSLVVEPYENPKDLPGVVIVDIDGTVAKMAGRSPYEWHRVNEDSPVDAVISAVRSAAYQYDIIFMSGRDESCRDITEAWLGKNVGVPFQLYMRPEGDNRKDDLVKYELFNAHIRGQFHVRYVLDDRNQVVRMWRALGLPCFQVAEGDF